MLLPKLNTLSKIVLLFLVSTLLMACSYQVEEKTTEKLKPEAEGYFTVKDADQEKIDYHIDQKFDDVARYIAGYVGKQSSSVKELENLPQWKDYQTNINSFWTKTNSKLPLIKAWSNEELSDVNSSGGTLFYPFSGADFLHVDLFFPDYDNIAMIALEPIGTFPDLSSKKREKTLPTYLANLKKSMHAILGLSFFRTIAMADDFQSEMDGTLHVIMHFMARANHEVMYQEQVAILPNGEISNDLTNISDSTYVGNRFYFKRKGEEKVKTLTYFAVNIQDSPYHSRGGLYAKGLESRTDLVGYFENLDIKATYLKSASYLLHRETFSIVRDIILDESEFLLQDDSGIPVQYFDENKWDLTFYGNYVQPISLFEERHQDDLKEIYQKKEKTVKSLPFGIGYQFVKGTSNLMKARKK